MPCPVFRQRFRRLTAVFALAALPGCHTPAANPAASGNSAPLASANGASQPTSGTANPGELRIAAAADLTQAFTEEAEAFVKAGGPKSTLVFGASGQLAQQIGQGAPFDVFAAANTAYVTDLEKRGLILPGTRREYAKGRLAFVAKTGGLACPKTFAELATPPYKRIAIANPQTAPYGKLAQSALEKAGVWQTVQPRLVFGENIRATLQYVASGNADAALVSQSLASGPNLQSAPVPPQTYTPLSQAIAVVQSSRQPEVARRFVTFVVSPPGRAILARHHLAP